MGKAENRPDYLAQAENLYNLSLDHAERGNAPNQRECYRGLAVLLGEQGRYDEARRLLQGWADRQAGSADAKIELARLEEEMGNKPAAEQRLVDALAVDPNNPRALAALGKIREDMGQQSQALANYQRSLASDRFQPAVAARVSALQASTMVAGAPPPTAGSTWTAPTRTVNAATPAYR
jgi:tetratricopeptide (TPR) repeat protein